MSGQARVWGAVTAKAERAALALPRLLVIDSDNLHRMIICRAADKAGYIPAGAANFTEAAKLARTTVFDCITLDLSLGQQTGEMLRHLREIMTPEPPLTKVEARQRCMAEVPNAYLEAFKQAWMELDSSYKRGRGKHGPRSR